MKPLNNGRQLNGSLMYSVGAKKRSFRCMRPPPHPFQTRASLLHHTASLNGSCQLSPEPDLYLRVSISAASRSGAYGAARRGPPGNAAAEPAA